MKIGRILISAALAVGIMLSACGCSQKGSVGNTGIVTVEDGDKLAVIEIKDYGTIKAKLFPDLAPIAVENFIQLAEQGYYNGLKIHRITPEGVIQGGSLNGDGTGGAAAYTGNDKNSNSTVFPLEINKDARNYYGALGYAADNYGQNSCQFYIVNCKTSKDVTVTDPTKVKARADELASAIAEATWEADSEIAKVSNYLQSYYSSNAEMLTKIEETAALKYKQTGGLYEIDGAYTVFGQTVEGFEVIDKLAAAELETNAQGEKSMPVVDIIISSVTIETFKTSTAEESDNTSKASQSTAPSAEEKREADSETVMSASAETSTKEENISTIDTKEAAQ